MFLSFDNLSAECFLNYLLANYAFLNFDLLSVRSLNFPKISASFFIGLFFIIGDCVYDLINYYAVKVVTIQITSKKLDPSQSKNEDCISPSSQ